MQENGLHLIMFRKKVYFCTVFVEQNKVWKKSTLSVTPPLQPAHSSVSGCASLEGLSRKVKSTP